MDGGAVGVILSVSGAGISFLTSALIIAFKMGKQSRTIEHQGDKLDTHTRELEKFDKKVDKHGNLLAGLDTKVQGLCERTTVIETRLNSLIISKE